LVKSNVFKVSVVRKVARRRLGLYFFWRDWAVSPSINKTKNLVEAGLLLREMTRWS